MKKKHLNVSVVSLLLIGVFIYIALPDSTDKLEVVPPPPLLVSPPPPLLIPPTKGESEWRDPVQAAAEHNRQVAYLDGETGIPEVRFLPVAASSAETEVSYAIRSVVTYSENGHTTVVSLAEPSAAAMRTPTLYGQKTVTLPNGEQAWLTNHKTGDLPHSLVLTRGRQIITVASTMSLDEMFNLAARVKISP